MQKTSFKTNYVQNKKIAPCEKNCDVFVMVARVVVLIEILSDVLTLISEFYI